MQPPIESRRSDIMPSPLLTTDDQNLVSNPIRLPSIHLGFVPPAAIRLLSSLSAFQTQGAR
jgi:hypothetical protein